MSVKIKALIQEITALAVTISTTTKHAVTARYTGICNMFEVDFYKGGFNESRKIDCQGENLCMICMNIDTEKEIIEKLREVKTRLIKEFEGSVENVKAI